MNLNEVIREPQFDSGQGYKIVGLKQLHYILVWGKTVALCLATGVTQQWLSVSRLVSLNSVAKRNCDGLITHRPLDRNQALLLAVSFGLVAQRLRRRANNAKIGGSNPP